MAAASTSQWSTSRLLDALIARVTGEL